MSDDKPVVIKDAFKNLATGIGTTSDRRTQGYWDASAYCRSDLENMLTASWLTRAIVSVPAEEATRNWRTITTPSMTPEQVDTFESEERRLKVRSHIANALMWSDLFGGSGIYAVVEGANPVEELAPLSVSRGTRINFIVFDRDELSATYLYSDEVSPLYGLPGQYQIHRSGSLVHGSRLIRFDGEPLPRRLFEQNSYWGWSVIEPLRDDIERAEMLVAALAQLVDEANVDVIAVPELFAKLANMNTAADVRARFAEGDVIKSLYKVQLLDKKEEYQRHELSGSLSGLTQLLDAFLRIPAAGSGIPVTKLLGTSPGGLSATGESDLENYYDMVDCIRANEVSEALEVTDELICRSVFGNFPADWAYEWVPLWQESRKDQVDVESKQIESWLKVMQGGVITPSIVAQQIVDNGYMPAITPDFIDDLRALEEQDDPTAMPEEQGGSEVSEENEEQGDVEEEELE